MVAPQRAPQPGASYRRQNAPPNNHATTPLEASARLPARAAPRGAHRPRRGGGVPARSLPPTGGAGAAPFNFAAASGRPTEGAVNGCCMPGFSDPLPAPGSVGAAQVAEWAAFMRSRGVTDAVVLLGGDELASYFAPPGLAALYRAEGITPHLLQARAPGAHSGIMAVFGAVDASGGARKAVTHCTGGCHRVGCVLTAWLAHK
ncbi:MAG: hypothetical protein J3K34DRAFT_401169 [Monoraphidium minutum]|nr:MAG: hypothetical protein J3K34DRAFT_401169 [Monoraphidium minutum]